MTEAKLDRIIGEVTVVREKVAKIEEHLKYQNGTIKALQKSTSKNTDFVSRFKGAMALATASGIIGLVAVVIRYLSIGG